jgi:exopolyphosphatase/guanosine-5'-triphosphate,3'-diphosphate pyrophosphatase
MKLAAIDIGSNSIHMVIVEVAADGSIRVTDREKDMIGLGRGTLERNFLDEKTMELGVAALSNYAKLARRHGVDEVLAVATSAVREALNGGDFIERIRRVTGMSVRVITAVEEARLIGLAVREGIDLAESSALVMDMGGGSTASSSAPSGWPSASLPTAAACRARCARRSPSTCAP